jgi:hypothetical protein
MRVFVILVGAQRHYKRSDGTFDIDLWKSLVAEFRGVELDEFVEDGTTRYLVRKGTVDVFTANERVCPPAASRPRRRA